MFNYGWVVLVITVLLEGLSGFGRTASFSPFLKDVCRDLAVTSAQISLIYGLANLLTGIALPHIGRWYDRYPTKYFLRVFVMLFGGAFIGMSALKIIAAPSLFNLCVLFCAFVAIRMSVQSYMLTVRCMVAAWFKENRGFATGLTCLLLASVASSMPHLNLRLSRFFAWQHVWFTVGIFWLCIMLFVVRWIKKPPAETEQPPAMEEANLQHEEKTSDDLNAESKGNTNSPACFFREPSSTDINSAGVDVQIFEAPSVMTRENEYVLDETEYFSSAEHSDKEASGEVRNGFSGFRGNGYPYNSEHKAGTPFSTASETGDLPESGDETDENFDISQKNTPENFEKSANSTQKTMPSGFTPLPSSAKTSPSDISTHTKNPQSTFSPESAAEDTVETFKSSPALWLIMMMLFFKAFQMTALAFHLVPMCEAFGARAENVTLCLMGTPVVTILTTFVAGHFFEKIGIRNTLFLFLLLDISLLYSFQYIANNFILCMYGLTAGAYWGMRQILAYMVLPKIFGTKHIGTVNGWASACLCLGSATGPYFFAKCHEAHSYLFALNLCQGFAVLLLLICLTLQKHFKPREN